MHAWDFVFVEYRNLENNEMNGPMIDTTGTYLFSSSYSEYLLNTKLKDELDRMRYI